MDCIELFVYVDDNYMFMHVGNWSGFDWEVDGLRLIIAMEAAV